MWGIDDSQSRMPNYWIFLMCVSFARGTWIQRWNPYDPASPIPCLPDPTDCSTVGKILQLKGGLSIGQLTGAVSE